MENNNHTPQEALGIQKLKKLEAAAKEKCKKNLINAPDITAFEDIQNYNKIRGQRKVVRR